MTKSRLHIVVWFIFVAITFWLLDQFSISVGDDLGYMFTDTTLHKCDGKLITSVEECLSTQLNHYFTTNGRFFVHFTTHIFIALAGLNIFRIFNALMFSFLWLFIVKFIRINNDDENEFCFLLILFLLWIFIPDIGTTALSLVAYAINYLWTAVLYLGYILLLKKYNKKNLTFKSNSWKYIILSLLSIFVGSLHESYNIPIGISLFILSIKYFKHINTLIFTMIISFFIGASIEIFAPGNFSHAIQGGGFSIENILRKSTLLSEELLLSSINFLFVLLLILFIFSRDTFKKIFHENIFFIIVIVVSLIFALFTFTSARQIFCPSICAIIIIGRILTHIIRNVNLRQITSTIMGICFAIIIIIGYSMRKNVYETYHNQVIKNLGSKSSTLFMDISSANHNINNILIRKFADIYAPDPLANNTLHLLFDGYTKKGLSRIGWENGKSMNLKNIIPYPAKTIENKFSGLLDSLYTSTDKKFLKSKVISLDCRYNAIRVSTEIKDYNKYSPYISIRAKKVIPYEKFRYGEYIYFILSYNSPDTIILKQ